MKGHKYERYSRCTIQKKLEVEEIFPAYFDMKDRHWLSCATHYKEQEAAVSQTAWCFINPP